MKRILCFLFAMLCFSVAGFSQVLVKQAYLNDKNTTAVGDRVTLVGGNSEGAAKFHRILFYARGTVSTCQVKLEQSVDGNTSWTDLIANQTCTSTGSSAVTVETDVNYVRLNLGTMSGGGFVTVVYQGFATTPAAAAAGAVTVTSGTITNIADPVTVTDGAGALNVICDSGCAGGTEYAQGTATTDTDVLKMDGAVRRDTAAVATGVANGDRLALSTDSVGRLRVTSADVTQPISGTVTVTDGAGALNVIVDSGTLTAVTSITNTVNVTGTGTAGSPASGVVTVQGITNGTAQPVSGTVTANIGTLPGITVASVAGTSTTAYTAGATNGDVRVNMYGDQLMAISPNGITVVSLGLTATVVTVSSVPGVVDAYNCTNTDATNFAFVQMFDTTGAPTLGTGQAWIIGLPPNGGQIGPLAPLPFRAGIKIAATTTAAGSTGVDAAEVTCSWKIKQ